MDTKVEIKEEHVYANATLTEVKSEYEGDHFSSEAVSSHFIKECASDSEIFNDIEIKEEPCWSESTSCEVEKDTNLSSTDVHLKDEIKRETSRTGGEKLLPAEINDKMINILEPQSNPYASSAAYFGEDSTVFELQEELVAPCPSTSVTASTFCTEESNNEIVLQNDTTIQEESQGQLTAATTESNSAVTQPSTTSRKLSSKRLTDSDGNSDKIKLRREEIKIKVMEKEHKRKIEEMQERHRMKLKMMQEEHDVKLALMKRELEFEKIQLLKETELIKF